MQKRTEWAKRPISVGELADIVSFSEEVFRDVGRILAVNLADDLLTLKGRVACEGIAFLSVKLPDLARALERGLAAGALVSIPSSFKKVRGTMLPAFLQGCFTKLFERDGTLRESADPRYVWGIREIGYLWRKYNLPYSTKQLMESMKKFVDLNVSLPDGDHSCLSHSNDLERGVMLRTAAGLIGEVLHSVDLRSVIPRNGPGACNNPLIQRQSDKHDCVREFDEKLEAVYPLNQLFSPSFACLRSKYSRALPEWGGTPQNEEPVKKSTGNSQCRSPYPQGVNHGSRTIDRESKVCPVAKDSGGPRLIGEENSELQAIQQGQRRILQGHFEHHPLTRGHLNFGDQSVNRRLALIGSIDGLQATLDQSSASDRVSVWLVRLLMEKVPDVLECLEASRSTHALLPQYEYNTKLGFVEVEPKRIELKTFSMMGSGVCFVLESLVFWSLTVAALETTCGISRQAALRCTYVYGDDIIVPALYATKVMEALELCYLKFNKNKSFSEGLFRESCGLDAYKGLEVTPLRIKSRLPETIADANSIVAWVKYANQFEARNMWASAEWIRKYLRERIPVLGRLPKVPKDAGILGWCYEDNTINPEDTRWQVEQPKEFAPKIVRRTYYETDPEGITRVIHKVRLVDVSGPFLQGLTRRGWIPVYEKYAGKDRGLTELGRYMRFVSERSDTDAFGERNVLWLEPTTYVFT
jgi:hypothetical protein